jgi:glycosyltransferase involved in cell wall biosynthesis
MTLSIVMPVYNEAAVIERLVLEIERDLVERLDEIEIELIVVDDCSTDATGAILGRLARDRPWIRLERAAVNAGHGPSVLRGLRSSTGDWIFQLDSDGQFVVEEFHTLWRVRDDADLVLGVRSDRRDAAHRLVLSRIIALAVSFLARRRLRDANSPFRLLRRELWEDLEPLIGRHALAPSIMVSLGAVRRGWRVRELPVTHLARTHGPSTLRSLRLLSFSLAGLRELLAFHRRLEREQTRVPVAARGLT